VKLSIVMPAHNEAGTLPDTVRALYRRLAAEAIPHEILVVEDHSTDATRASLEDLTGRVPTCRWIMNTNSPGYGYAVRAGLDQFLGDAVCIAMADGSDDPADVVVYYRKLEEGYECVFGSRFIDGAQVIDYPFPKLMLNRLANWIIKILFGLPFNDVTNAFKAFRREVIEGLRPLLACHFNLTVELPLKAIVRGYSYAVVPIHWHGRKTGVSKFRIKEMGSRYAFIMLYVLLEKWLSRGDYRRVPMTGKASRAPDGAGRRG
jgi:dolichol-phosphate mannosyltransferase